MSAAACAKIILCGNQLRALASSAESLAELELDCSVSVPPELTEALGRCLDESISNVGEYVKKMYAEVRPKWSPGPP